VDGRGGLSLRSRRRRAPLVEKESGESHLTNCCGTSSRYAAGSRGRQRPAGAGSLLPSRTGQRPTFTSIHTGNATINPQRGRVPSSGVRGWARLPRLRVRVRPRCFCHLPWARRSALRSDGWVAATARRAREALLWLRDFLSAGDFGDQRSFQAAAGITSASLAPLSGR
jgi:hypothetical protein